MMRTLSLEQMENLQGGWHYTWKQHVGCAIGGLCAGFGVAGAFAYAGCLLACY